MNDELGHKAGDEVLLSFVDVIKKTMRAGDKAFRYGGEEFITISSIEDASQATGLAERIREAMEARTQHGSVKRMITCSAGVAIAPPLYIPLN